MYQIVKTNTFRRNFKNYQHDPKIITELSKAVDLLIYDKLDIKLYLDHPLKGHWLGYREFHLLPNVLIVYQKDEKEMIITLVAMGSHNKLFH